MGPNVNLWAAWIGILLGMSSGVIPGLFFRGEKWMGGYASWERRLTRLGHISFFGLGFTNLGYALTMRSLGVESGQFWPSLLFIVGAISMPTVCYLCAWKPPVRHLFFIPVTSLLAATVLTLIELYKVLPC